jgi:hypothetical protein
MRGIAALVLLSSCLALTPSAWAENGKGHGHGHEKGPAIAMAPGRIVIHERDRTAAYSYYRTEFIGGRCPPGLAKKGNGCLPPGLARRAWLLGAPLAPAAVFYPLPAPLLTQLSPAPAGYQYVRVDNDILLMASGTRVVSAVVLSLTDLRDARAPLIAEPDREAIVAYYRSDYLAGNCPAGLMRTDAGCQAKPLWTLGAPLEPSVSYDVLPEPLLAQLSPVPDGYQYIRMADRVLLLEVETRVIRADVLDLARLPLRIAVSVPVPAPAPAASGVVVQERVDYLGGGGSCPPGLAKKNNGCLPPGHAK